MESFQLMLPESKQHARTLVECLTATDPEGQHGPCRQAILDRDGQIIGWKEYRRGD